MRYRELGTTGITVSEIGFGLWTVSTRMWGITDEAVGLRMLPAAFDGGITLFDTADTYGNGAGQTMIARALKGKRDKIVIADKFGYDIYNYGDKRVGQREIPQDFSPAYARKALEGSLQRLETDYIDVWQLHNVKLPDLQRDDLFALLDDLVAEGKLRTWGVALGPRIGWLEEGLLAVERRKTPVLHMIYNLLEQHPGRELMDACRQIGAGVMVRVPHSSGLLEGVYSEETTFDANDHRSFRSCEWLTEGLKKVEKLDFLAEGTGRSISDAAIKWLLADPLVATVLPNIYNAEQLQSFIHAVDTPDLSAEEVARVNALFDHNFYLEPVAGGAAPS